MKRIYLAAILGVALSLVSCATTTTLYDWKGYDKATFTHTKQSTEESLTALLEVYAKLTENPKGTRHVPAPGICADYGYLLILKGETERGKELLVRETTLYPESKQFIDRVLKRFEK